MAVAFILLQKDTFAFRQDIPASASCITLLSDYEHCTSSTRKSFISWDWIRLKGNLYCTKQNSFKSEMKNQFWVYFCNGFQLSLFLFSCYLLSFSCFKVLIWCIEKISLKKFLRCSVWTHCREFKGKSLGVLQVAQDVKSTFVSGIILYFDFQNMNRSIKLQIW